MTLTTADTVVTPKSADATVWAAAIDVIRRPAPPYEGRLLHRDFQPGNVLFDVPPSRPEGARITGVVDWAAASWGPADLDVAASEEVQSVSQPWREAGRTELTTRAVEERLDAYVTALMGTLG